MFFFGKTIPEILLEQSKIKCLVCSKNNEEQLFTLNCSCIFCDVCLTDYINKATDKRIILTNYEISKIFYIIF